MFDPHEDFAPDGTRWPHNPNSEFASLAVYVQGLRKEAKYWQYIEFQIWRAKTTSEGKRGISKNIVVQARVHHSLSPCDGDLDYSATPPRNMIQDYRFARVKYIDNGSPSMRVGMKESFTAKDSGGGLRLQGCKYYGADYVATSSDGLFAGILACFDSKPATTVHCTRPQDNRATTCGGAPAEDCGTLGEDCLRFHQLLATCRM